MKAVVRVVSNNTFLSTGRSILRFAAASSRAPAAPTPAASVGVAKPRKMLPSTAKINRAGGRMAMSSWPTAGQSIGWCSMAGAACGRSSP